MKTLSRRELSTVLGLSTGLTLLMAAPVLRHPTERLFGSELVGRHADAYIVLRQFDGALQLTAFTQPATDWLGVLATRLVGPVAAYNLVVLLTFPLATLFTYLLARQLLVLEPASPAGELRPLLGADGVSRLASGVAGFAYGFAPFHLAHAAYHPHVAQTQWLPLYLLALWRCLDRWSLPRGLLLAIATGLLVLSNFYAALIGAVLTPVALAAYWWSVSRGTPDGRKGLAGTIATLVASGLLGFGYLAVAAPQVLSGRLRFAFEYQDLFRYCARWWSYLMPPSDHLLSGALARLVWEQHPIADGLVEQQISLSLALTALGLVAGVAWVRRWRDGESWRGKPWGAVPALGILAAVAFLCSLPPEGRIAWLPRPSGLLHSVLPMFRAYARFGFVVHLAVALLAAIGITHLLASGRRGSRAVTFGLLLVAAVELLPFPPWRWHWLLPTEAHRWLEDQPGPMRILDCVVARPGERSVGWFLPHPIDAPRGSISDCGEPALAGKLAALGYTHVLSRSDYYLAQHVDQQGLATISDFSDSRILAVEAPPAAVYTRELGGFSWREIDQERTYRWMAERGNWTVVNGGTDPVVADLEIELSAFAGARHLEVLLNGTAVGRLDVDPKAKSFALESLRLRPGTNELSFHALAPATPAASVEPTDARLLTVALGGWRWSVVPEASGTLQEPAGDP